MGRAGRRLVAERYSLQQNVAELADQFRSRAELKPQSQIGLRGDCDPADAAPVDGIR
jgi:hypothetical protein